MLSVFYYVYWVTQRAMSCLIYTRILEFVLYRRLRVALPKDRIPHMHGVALEDKEVVFYFAYSDVHIYNVVDSLTMDQMSGRKLLHVCPRNLACWLPVTNSAAKLFRLQHGSCLPSTINCTSHALCYRISNMVKIFS